MNKVQKPASAATSQLLLKVKRQQSATVSSTSQEKPIKKQTSLGDFFTGVKKKEIITVPTINSDIGGDGKWAGHKSIKLACWNVNGLRAVLKREDLQNYMNNSKLDVLCLNETKIDEGAFIKEKIYEMIPKGYFQYWNFCIPPIKGYSGVAVLSKEKAISVKQGIDIYDHSQEGRILTVEYAEFYLVVVYVPNSGGGLKRLDYRVNSFDKDFQNYLNKLKLIKNVVLCGDLNVAHKDIDITNPEQNQSSPGFTYQERASFGNFLKSGWVDTFRDFYPLRVKYSWWSPQTGARQKNIGWRIDYFVVNKEFKKSIKDSMINNDVYGSDHCPVEVLIDLPEDDEKTKESQDSYSEQATQEKISSSLLEKQYQEQKELWQQKLKGQEMVHNCGSEEQLLTQTDGEDEEMLQHTQKNLI